MSYFDEKRLKLQKSNYSITQNYVKYKCTIENNYFPLLLCEIMIYYLHNFSNLLINFFNPVLQVDIESVIIK